MKTLNLFIHGTGATRVLALAMIAQLIFTAAGSFRAQAQCATTTASGQFGAGNALTWELCNDGTLTISGTGEMPDLNYTYANGLLETNTPWKSYRNDVIDVSITSGIAVIGELAFADCPNLQSVDIPESVEAIGTSAFANCDLTSVTVPKNVATIGTSAFRGNVNLAAITVDPDNTYFKVTNGALLSYDGTRLVQYPTGNVTDSYTVPSLVETIEVGAFAKCSHLTSVTLPASLTSIGSYAFQNCTLTGITLNSATPPTLGTDVFDGLTLSDITLHIPAGSEANYTSGVWTGFGSTRIAIPSSSLEWELSGGTLTVSGTGAMPNYLFGTPTPWNTVKSTITSVIIESGVTSIGLYAFAGCSSLTAFTVDPGNGNYSSSADGVLFSKDNATLIQYPEGKTGIYAIPTSVNAIASVAFLDCAGLTSVTIPTSVSTIGLGAFNGCTGLTSVTLPSSVSTIGDETFAHCTGLTGITVNYTSASDIPDINGKDVFSGVTPGNVTLHIAGGTGKSDYTAKGWPSGFCYSGTFGATNGLTWKLCGGTLTIEGSDAMDDFANYNDQPWASNRGDITDIIIEEGVTSVGDFAFNGCTALESVTIPASVETIGRNAFSTCAALETVTFAPSSLLTGIGIYAFSGCSGLESIDFPASVTAIGEAAFFNCSSLETLSLPASVGAIGASAFSMCAALETVTFAPSSLLTDIGANAFGNCSDLTSIDIPASVTAIGASAFENSGLTTVTVNWTTAGDIPTINANVFDGLPLPLSQMTLNVPTGTEDDYKAVSVWQNFGTIQFVATLTLSQTALSFTAAAGSETVTVTANTAWTAVSSDASWLTVAPPAGTGNDVLTLTVTAHTGSSARTGTVTVSYGGSLTQAVTVTQAGVSAPPPPPPSTLTVTAGPVSFGAPGGAQTLAVTSNIAWTVTLSGGASAWLTVTPSSGTGNGTLTVTAQPNTGASRTATLTLSGGSLTRTVTLTQSSPGQPSVRRHVTLRIEGSAVSVPAAGVHEVVSGENFTFTLTPPAGQVPVVQTGRLIDGEPETLTGTPDASGAWTFVVRQIREDLTVAVTFVTGTAAVPAPQVWLSGRVLHVRTAPAGPLALYAVSGALVLRLDKPTGDAVFDLSALPRGLYILRAATGPTVKIQIQ